jgi:hypothetical protein
LWPKPAITLLGRMVTPAAAVAVVARNDLLLNLSFIGK